jgi:thiol:disulfide interchange protein
MKPEHPLKVLAKACSIIGGLILNLMPCVFPILSMKALSLVVWVAVSALFPA